MPDDQQIVRLLIGIRERVHSMRGCRNLKDACRTCHSQLPLVNADIDAALAQVRSEGAQGWQDIASAPKGHHSVIDLWCVGDRDDIAFYCANYCGVKDQMLWQGRVADVWWRDGAWRPKSSLRLHALTVTPTHWSRPLGAPPRSSSDLQGDDKNKIKS